MALMATVGGVNAAMMDVLPKDHTDTKEMILTGGSQFNFAYLINPNQPLIVPSDIATNYKYIYTYALDTNGEILSAVTKQYDSDESLISTNFSTGYQRDSNGNIKNYISTNRNSNGDITSSYSYSATYSSTNILLSIDSTSTDNDGSSYTSSQTFNENGQVTYNKYTYYTSSGTVDYFYEYKDYTYDINGNRLGYTAIEGESGDYDYKYVYEYTYNTDNQRTYYKQTYYDSNDSFHNKICECLPPNFYLLFYNLIKTKMLKKWLCSNAYM